MTSTAGVGRNIFQNKWGTKARILVMVGGGHAALVGRCLIYVRPRRVRIPKDLGSGIWATWQEYRGQIKGFLIWFCSFWDFTLAFWKSPFSHFLFATLCDLCVALLFASLWGCWQIALEMSYWLTHTWHCCDVHKHLLTTVKASLRTFQQIEQN